MLRLRIPPDTYEFDPTDITNKEAKQVERFTGQRISHFEDRELRTSDADNVTMLVWLARRRNGEPDLKIEDVEFRMNDVTIEDADDPTDDPVAGDPPAPTIPGEESGDGSEPG